MIGLLTTGLILEHVLKSVKITGCYRDEGEELRDADESYVDGFGFPQGRWTWTKRGGKWEGGRDLHFGEYEVVREERRMAFGCWDQSSRFALW